MENILEYFEDEDLVLNPQAIGLLMQGPHQAPLNLLLVENENEPVRNANYVEEVIPRYNPDEFFGHFRMSRNVFQELTEDIGNQIPEVTTIPVMKKVLFAIWMMAKPESFIACCDRFGISKGSGHLIFHDICKILCNLMESEICWPRVQEATATKTFYLEKTRFPGIVGSIDGCHIPIKAPVNNPIDYYNRNSYHSVILQGVCDHKMLFIDIFVGMPGRVHDARVFRNSPLYDAIMNENEQFIPPDMHLLGDSAYPLLPNVMVPFRDNGHLSAHQHMYNTIHSKCRSKIEQAFGRLKGKWRRLKYLDMNIENIPQVITAACVLHNYTLRREAVSDDIEMVPAEIEEILGDEEPQEYVPMAAVAKRSNIMNLIV